MKTEARFVTDGMYLRDATGRVVILRGCNLGGDSKIPASPPGAPLSADVSFVGRPFPEDEADAHFGRLARWGFTFLRLVITWEAVEHSGPGVYDEEYLSYLRSVLKRAEAHGISVFVDPHQDVWSRWTGGDGAPLWTLEAVGLDPARFDAAGAAITREGQGSSYRPMSWGLNYLRYAAATMNTLFFAGNAFAPGFLVEGVPVQDWLQDRFIAAMCHVARRIKDCAAVVGFGLFNEPHYGFVGLADLRSHGRITAPSGAVLSAFDAMASASGYPRPARRFALFGMLTLPGRETINPAGESVFRPGHSCPWKLAGVWTDEGGGPVLKKSGYFAAFPAGHPRAGERVSFCGDFLKPFQLRLMAALSKKHAHYLFFAEGVPMGERVSWRPEDLVRDGERPFQVVDALHWYDGLTLLSKKWRSWIVADAETSVPTFGRSAVRRSVRDQLSRLAARPRAEGMPAFLGEFGVPFDLNGGSSYRTGDFSGQERALSSYYDGIDAALLHSTIWNYAAGNTHRDGDGWNTEDLSIYCAEDGGGRAVRGFSRPYAMATSGMPLAMSFDRDTARFSYEWDSREGVTEIYVPGHWYPDGWETRVEAAGGGSAAASCDSRPAEQRLYVTTGTAGRLRLVITPVA